jgi:O-antigen ligase
LSNTGLQIIAGLLGMVLALLSGSRGQVIFSALLVAAFLPMSFPRRSLSTYFVSMIGFGMVLLTLYFAYTSVLSRYGQDRWSAAELTSGANDRAVLATTLLEAWMADPPAWFIGLGGSAFNAYYQFRPENTPHWYPHNIALEALCEYGAVGFAMFTATLYMTFSNARKLWAGIAHDVKNRSATAALYGLAVFELLVSLKQGYLLAPPPLFMFIIIIGKLSWNERRIAAEATDESLDEYAETELAPYASDEDEEARHSAA